MLADPLRRALALDLYRIAVAAAEPGQGVRRAMADLAPRLDRARRVTLIAVGKAACPMAEAALPQVRQSLRRALVVTTAEAARPLDGAKVLAGGHPIPDEGSLRAGQAAQDALAGLGPGDVVLLLVSGGGSALLAAPPPGVTLADKIALTDRLLRSGAAIDDINAVRSAVSALKGGGLARLAAPAPVEALLLSDVPGDDVAVIASGLSAPGAADPARARGVLRRHGLWDATPATIRAHLGQPSRVADAAPRVTNRVIGSNAQSVAAMAAAAHATGRRVEVVPGWLDSDVADAATRLVARLVELAADGRPAVLLAGGETTVTVRGAGTGGRNQELALRLATLADRAGLSVPWAFLSAGTDGRDGPTDAAGAVVDAATLARLRAAGLDPARALARNDSHPALRASGDLIPATPTGTNVADVQVAVVG